MKRKGQRHKSLSSIKTQKGSPEEMLINKNLPRQKIQDFNRKSDSSINEHVKISSAGGVRLTRISGNISRKETGTQKIGNEHGRSKSFEVVSKVLTDNTPTISSEPLKLEVSNSNEKDVRKWFSLWERRKIDTLQGLRQCETSSVSGLNANKVHKFVSLPGIKISDALEILRQTNTSLALSPSVNESTWTSSFPGIMMSDSWKILSHSGTAASLNTSNAVVDASVLKEPLSPPEGSCDLGILRPSATSVASATSSSIVIDVSDDSMAHKSMASPEMSFNNALQILQQADPSEASSGFSSIDKDGLLNESVSIPEINIIDALHMLGQHTQSDQLMHAVLRSVKEQVNKLLEVTQALARKEVLGSLDSTEPESDAACSSKFISSTTCEKQNTEQEQNLACLKSFDVGENVELRDEPDMDHDFRLVQPRSPHGSDIFGDIRTPLSFLGVSSPQPVHVYDMGEARTEARTRTSDVRIILPRSHAGSVSSESPIPTGSSCELQTNESQVNAELQKKLPDNVLFAQDSDGDTYLHLAISRGNNELSIALIKLMKNESLDVQNKLGQTPLHLAVHLQNIDLVKQLVHHGASVAAMDRNGDTPLHFACSTKKPDVVYCMMYGDGSVKENVGLRIALATKNYSGISPLHVAFEDALVSDDDKIVRLLLQANCDINTREDSFGKTCLFKAVEKKNFELAYALINRGADVSIPSFSGCSPLHLASEYGHTEMIKRLIEKDASLYAKNADLQTPKDVASSNEVKQLLEKAMKKARRCRQKKKQIQNFEKTIITKFVT